LTGMRQSRVMMALADNMVDECGRHVEVGGRRGYTAPT